MNRRMACLALGMMISMGCAAQQTQGAERSEKILEPVDGAVVTSPFLVKFGVTGMEVRPAGESGANFGHHHLIVDRGAMKEGEAVPYDEEHIHFGKGQTESMVSLKPGTYKLTAQFADGFHHSYGPVMSHTISVTVK